MMNCRLGAVPTVWVKIPQSGHVTQTIMVTQVVIVRKQGIEERIAALTRRDLPGRTTGPK